MELGSFVIQMVLDAPRIFRQIRSKSDSFFLAGSYLSATSFSARLIVDRLYEVLSHFGRYRPLWRNSRSIWLDRKSVV